MPQENTSASDEMATNPVPRPTMMKLPNETLFHIADYLDECDLAALCRVNRRLAVVTPVLWNKLFDNPSRCKEVLLWAVEVGEHRILQCLLERGVDPNFFYLSSLLRSRLMDVLSAQGRRGMLKPRTDRTLAAESFRSEYCRSSRMRARTHLEREQEGNWDIRFPLERIWDDLPRYIYFPAFAPQLFRLADDLEDPRGFWTWTPLHVAVQRGDDAAVRMLLQHGADINAQCSGLCDCAFPDLAQEDNPDMSVTPSQFRPFWTPLHVAICSGHEPVAELLMSSGASERVGSLVRQPSPLQRKGRLDITALQSAAWLGSVGMCKVFLDKLTSGPVTSQFGNHCLTDRHDRTALLYAAASGNIQTVGKLLLKGGASLLSHYQTHYLRNLTPDQDDKPPLILISDPVRLLCMQYRYDDARWLLNHCRPLSDYTIGSHVLHYTRYLAALCFLRPRAVCNPSSLRVQQDRLFSLTPHDLSRQAREKNKLQEIKESEPHRLSLAKRLLDLGADPNRAEVTEQSTMPIFPPRPSTTFLLMRTPLQLAASCGFAKMVKLLVTRGANPDLIVGQRRAELSELPLMLAVKQALFPGGNIETVQELLKAGASLDDRGDQSVLRVLYNMKPRKSPYGVLGDDWSDWQDWLRIVEMFLSHGAAARTSEGNWQKLLVSGCIPGNLRYCEMLEKARPVSNLSPETRVRMLRTALREMTKRQGASTQDTEMVRWVLRRSLDAQGRLLIPTDILREAQQQAYHHRLNRIFDVIGDFLTQTEAPCVSDLDRQSLVSLLRV
ncbi:hypothetical protein C8A03DRAFT_18369 [Achaetomium macrosporum]|uniref:F-box domain-containing protein n=1 Tax=Achaetomium macrosporum TaxID=79813 RepID=A0AAN7C3M8_9PEZI|nr:hypothetical protein C8A03DRAFT_18369 [Achaetomium macrosporum]